MIDDFGRAPADDLAGPSSIESDLDAQAALLLAQPHEGESVDTSATAPVVEVRPSLFARLFGRGRAGRRLHNLSAAIDRYPDSPSNYVMRGELYLEVGEAALAEADFRQALALTQVDFEASRWGLVAQALQDRARTGLRKARDRQ